MEFRQLLLAVNTVCDSAQRWKPRDIPIGRFYGSELYDRNVLSVVRRFLVDDIVSICHATQTVKYNTYSVSLAPNNVTYKKYTKLSVLTTARYIWNLMRMLTVNKLNSYTVCRITPGNDANITVVRNTAEENAKIMSEISAGIAKHTATYINSLKELVEVVCDPTDAMYGERACHMRYFSELVSMWVVYRDVVYNIKYTLIPVMTIKKLPWHHQIRKITDKSDRYTISIYDVYEQFTRPVQLDIINITHDGKITSTNMKVSKQHSDYDTHFDTYMLGEIPFTKHTPYTLELYRSAIFREPFCYSKKYFAYFPDKPTAGGDCDITCIADDIANYNPSGSTADTSNNTVGDTANISDTATVVTKANTHDKIIIEPTRDVTFDVKAICTGSPDDIFYMVCNTFDPAVKSKTMKKYKQRIADMRARFLANKCNSIVSYIRSVTYMFSDVRVIFYSTQMNRHLKEIRKLFTNVESSTLVDFNECYGTDDYPPIRDPNIPLVVGDMFFTDMRITRTLFISDVVDYNPVNFDNIDGKVQYVLYTGYCVRCGLDHNNKQECYGIADVCRFCKGWHYHTGYYFKKCDECNGVYYSAMCYDIHKRTICLQYKWCMRCESYVPPRELNKPCGHMHTK